MKRRSVLALSLCFAAAAHAQLAGQSVTLVVPFPPGDALDTTARAVADALAAEIKMPVVVENRAGAAGAIAAEAVTRSTNQATFLWGTTAMMSITPFLRKTPYAPSDLVPVARVATISSPVALSNNLPAKTWAEFVVLAKQNPGKYSYASPGEGTGVHMSVEALQKAADIKLLHVPYKGMGPALQDFLGGRIDVYAEAAVIPHIKAGTARGVAVVGDTRLPDLPDVPTLRELKVPFEQVFWFGILAPKNVPAPLSDRVGAALRVAMARPDIKGRIPPGVAASFADAAGFAQQIQAEQVVYRKLIADLNIKLD